MREGQLVPIGQGRRRNDRWVDPKGHVVVRCDPDHPNAKEPVHHRNLIKSDNRPGNLELWASHQPKGARVADMLAWCRWFIGQYSEASENGAGTLTASLRSGHGDAQVLLWGTRTERQTGTEALQRSYGEVN